TLGWIAVSISTALACFWALWGINENFHEGWYFDSVWRNVGLMMVQYLLGFAKPSEQPAASSS
ncbi:MAG: hypothetical protein P4L51_14695, partial [Puia sp.]|nr:hypothetical protein [Puia sp.]